MASGSLPRSQHIGNTITTDGSQSFVGANHVNINFAASNDALYHERLLDKLPVALQAPFDASSQQDNALCLPDTRTAVLREMRAFVYAGSEQEQHIFWLNGMAGTGKSTIARTIARELREKRILGASFFFRRGGGDVAHAGMLFTSIAKQLARVSPELEKLICQSIKNDPDIATKGRGEQWMALVGRPLSQAKQSDTPKKLVILLDALDECDSDNDMKGIIASLSEAKAISASTVRIILTSRPETPIRLGFKKLPLICHRDLILHDQPRKEVEADLRLFYYDRIGEIRDQKHWLPGDWPGVDAINQLVDLAAGLFVIADTLCRFIAENEAEDSLYRILAGASRGARLPGSQDNDIRGDPIRKLEWTYVGILTRSLVGRESTSVQLGETLGAIASLQSPLSAVSFAALMSHRGPDVVYERLDRLHSVLQIPTKSHSPISLHDSFRTFLVDHAKRTIPHLPIEKASSHRHLFRQCLGIMNGALRQDVCDLRHPGAVARYLDRDEIEQCLPTHLQYACRYWMEHVRQCAVLDGKVMAQVIAEVHVFLTKHFLHWLEAMSIIERIDDAAQSLIRLRAWLETNGLGRDEDFMQVPARKANSVILHDFLHDAERFLFYARAGIEAAPLQIYCSALLFAPEQSVVRKHSVGDYPKWVTLHGDRDTSWDACVQVLEGHSGGIQTVAVSPDGQMLASGSYDKTIRLYDQGMGRCRCVLKDHNQAVENVTFSPDGRTLASFSGESVIRLWDCDTGTLRLTLEEHSNSITSVAFQPYPGRLIATASADSTVRLWHSDSGHCLDTIDHEFDQGISAVIFSPDGQRFVVASQNVMLWDTVKPRRKIVFFGPSSYVDSVAFSPDGQKIAAAGFEDGKVGIWNIGTSQSVITLKCHAETATPIIFSPDNGTLASASEFGSIQLWNSTDGTSKLSIDAHTENVTALVFLGSGETLASASMDKSIGIWHVSTGQMIHRFAGHSAPVTTLLLSPDGRTLISGSTDSTVMLWDIGSSRVTAEAEEDRYEVRAIRLSPDGKSLATTTVDNTMRLWCTLTGVCRHKLVHASDWDDVYGINFSPDSKMLASYGRDISIWACETGSLSHLLNSHDGTAFCLVSVIFSPDGGTMASMSNRWTVTLWNPSTGQCLHVLPDQGAWWTPPNSLTFSSNSLILASALSNHSIRLLDSRTGQSVHMLAGHCKKVTWLRFSPNLPTLASASEDRTVRLWNSSTGQLIHVLRGHPNDCYPEVTAGAFWTNDNNSSVLATASASGTIRLWNSHTGQYSHQMRDAGIRSIAVTLSPSGRSIASLSTYGTIELLDCSTGQRRCPRRELHYELDGEQSLSAFTIDAEEERSICISQNRAFVADHWVHVRSQPWIWLPPRYRPTRCTNFANMVALTKSPGKVFWLTFNTA